jgi:hypothetical protein
MLCESGKVIYPDLQTALTVRDAFIDQYAVPTLAYKCFPICQKWHLTTNRVNRNIGHRKAAWNNLITARQRKAYDERIAQAAKAHAE